MCWSSLPDDVVEVILLSLSLVELARVSMTCGTFQALYRRQLAQEHEARCGLAVRYFGRDLITTITCAIIQLLKGEPLSPSFDNGFFSVWGDMRTLTVTTHYDWRVPGDTNVVVEDCSTSRRLEVYAPQDRKGVYICVCPLDDGDVEMEMEMEMAMVAMVQAILSEGLAQFIRDAGKWAQVDFFQVWQVPASLDVLKNVGLKSQIGPLMQLASRCISKDPKDINLLISRWAYFKYRLQIGQVDNAADE